MITLLDRPERLNGSSPSLVIRNKKPILHGLAAYNSSTNLPGSSSKRVA